MKTFSRRAILKTGLLAPAAVAAAQGMGPMGAAMEPGEPSEPLFQPPLPDTGDKAINSAGRERLLLDFGWRFHFGNANDPAKDFGFGGVTGNFQKTGNFMPAGSMAFDDGEWREVNLPHDWAVELPFQNDPALQSKGFYPLGRKYPATSVGWYRRGFELPADDAGKRITIEFDGAYRETMVVFNGFYIGQHSGGYDPFSFDLTDFANAVGRNVLLVRVDATESDGWFYEGAGIYRHVWLVKTSPVHVPRWGTLVKADVQAGGASLSIRTEVRNHDRATQNVRVVSTILGPSGESAGKSTSSPAKIANGGEHAFEQKIEVRQAEAVVAGGTEPVQARDRVADGRRNSSIATRRGSASAPWLSMRTRDFFSTARRSSSRAPAITRTTPASAPLCRTRCSTTACASCRRWAAIRCAPRIIRRRRSCWMHATSWAC